MYQVSRSLGLVLSDLVKDRLFVSGLVFKIVLLSLFVPEIQTNWFVPFMTNAIENPSLNPWNTYSDIDGDILAFPYGPIMFLVQLPLTLLGWLIDKATGLGYFLDFGFRAGLLVMDILLLTLIVQQFEKYWKKILVHYWLSPIVIFITYWHGQLDLIPLTIMIFSIGLLKNDKLTIGAIFLALSIASKHSMLIAFPFVVIYLWFKKDSIKDIYRFLAYFLVSMIMLEGVFLFSHGFQEMVLSNPEAGKIFWLDFSTGEGLKIYILPLVYVLLIYSVWRLQRINYELLFASLGVAFSVIILLTQASPGWLIWITPMLALHLSKKGPRAEIFGVLLSFFFIAYHLSYSSGSSVLFLGDFIPLSESFLLLDQQQVRSLLNTVIVGLVAIVTLQMLRDGIKSNYYYNLGRRPLVLGVSGNVKTERLFFLNSLLELFGKNSVLKISEDNYYNWSDDSLMWKSMSYLNPKSTQLSLMADDLRKEVDGSVNTNNRWDKYQVILVDGVHSFFLRQLAKMQDVKFFIEYEKGFELEEKPFISDDKNSTKVKNDMQKYVIPQRDKANIVYTLPNTVGTSSNIVSLNIEIRDGFYYHDLLRILIGVCGLQANVEKINEYGDVKLAVRGEIVAEDIEFAFNVATPDLVELIKKNDCFYGGTFGIMQLVAFLEIEESLKRRKN